MSTHPNETLLYELALNSIPKIGPTAYRYIMAYAGSASNFFEMPAHKAAKIPRMSPKLLEFRKDKFDYLKAAEDTLRQCEAKDIQVLTFSSPGFPERLKGLDNCPMILYTIGQPHLNPERSLGIVGTRNVTDYGKVMTQRIVADLKPYGATVISGLAYGVDVEAHKSSLEQSLPTIGVLGTAIDQIYPSIHKKTALSMIESGGGLVSEYPPGAKVHATNFPQRNRIIAGLSDALIVVEAAKKGGALITAEIAYSYNREVFAVPGNLQATYSEGCNLLIRSLKASIFTGVKDIEECLSWSTDGNGSQGSFQKKLDLSILGEKERAIVERLQDKRELEIDELSVQLDIPISDLAIKLLTLEFEGFIKSLPGKKYRLS